MKKIKNDQATFMRLSAANKAWLEGSAKIHDVSVTLFLNKTLDQARLGSASKGDLAEILTGLETLVDRLKHLQSRG